ncbi:MAG: class I SAM-dependent methyltransferase [candidate division Zixibacteria bacterium]|nr:class I SAM-dependent methyltransferase [candidate division Zixibacteria bacterium]
MAESENCFFEVKIEDILKKHAQDGILEDYLSLLTLENEKINLVSRETSASDLKRLIAESLVPFEKLELKSVENYLDIGSGGGLPAIPIIITKNPAESILIERRNKKASALSRISLELKIKPVIIEQTFEEIVFDKTFDLITVRLVRLSGPILKKISEILSQAAVFIYYGAFQSDKCPPELSYTIYSYATGDDSPAKAFTIFKKTL